MAGFLDAKTRQPVSRVGVTKGAKFKIILWGGGPEPDYQKLIVTTDPTKPVAQVSIPDSSVATPQDQGNWFFLYEVDTSRIKGNKLRACLNDGRDYAEPVEIIFLSADKAEIRKSIVDLAQTFVADAHYLWGTAGNQPGIPNGNVGGGKLQAASLRAYSLSKTAADQDHLLAAAMAYQDQFDGYNSCAGRSRRCDQTQDLDAYITAREADIAAGNTDQATWVGPGKNLHPRKYTFRGTLQTGVGAVVWGESCQGHRHFDCVGLVNYCYAQHWYQASFGGDIVAFKNPNMGTTPITNDKDLMDADIIIPKAGGHIAMIYNGGNGSNGGPIWKIVQAEETVVGLTNTALFDPGKWDRYRMNSAYLVVRKVTGA